MLSTEPNPYDPPNVFTIPTNACPALTGRFGPSRSVRPIEAEQCDQLLHRHNQAGLNSNERSQSDAEIVEVLLFPQRFEDLGGGHGWLLFAGRQRDDCVCNDVFIKIEDFLNEQRWRDDSDSSVG